MARGNARHSLGTRFVAPPLLAKNSHPSILVLGLEHVADADHIAKNYISRGPAFRIFSAPSTRPRYASPTPPKWLSTPPRSTPAELPNGGQL